MIKALQKYPPHDAPAPALVPSPIRLLLGRVVALLVFAVSAAIPARWAGRRWVGGVVVGMLGVEFVGTFGALLGIMFGKLPASLGWLLGIGLIFELLTLTFFLKNKTFIHQSTASFFFPGFRLAGFGLDGVLIALYTTKPVLAVSALFFWANFEYSFVSWIVGVILFPAIVVSIVDTLNLGRMQNPNVLARLFILSSPLVLLTTHLDYRLSISSIGGQILVLLILVVHLAVSVRLLPLSFDISFQRSSVLGDSVRTRQECGVLCRVRGNIMEMAIPFFFEQLKDRPFLVGLLFYFIPFCELLLGSIILGLIGTLFFGLRGLGSGMGIAKIFGTLFPVFFLFGLVGLILSLPFARRSATGVIGYAIRMNHSRVYRTRVLWSAPVVAMFFSLFFSGLCALYVSRLPAPFDEYIITFVPFICAMTFLFVIMNAGEIGMFPLQVFLIGQCLQFVFAIFEIQFSSHGIFVYLIAMCILRFLHLLRTLRRGDLAY